MVKISIERLPHNIIATTINMEDIKNRQELSHIIAELESIKLKVLAAWENYSE